MTFEEFSRIGMALKSYYPKEERLLKDEYAIKIWYEALKDISYQTMYLAVNKWVSIERWSPTIADLRRLSFEVKNPDMLTWDEAWETVLEALNRYGYYRAREGVESLDEITRTVVRRIGWTTLCTSEQIGIERAAFRDMYNALIARTKENGQIAPAVRKVIEATKEQNRVAIPDKQKPIGDKPFVAKEPSEMSSKVAEMLKDIKQKLGELA